MKSINCLIVDDDEIDRLTVLANIRRYSFIQVRGAYATTGEAAAHMSRETIQMLLLDIEMPEMSGIDLRMRFLEVPVCIFITSYPDFALEGFEAAAFDYILKPFSADRFDLALQRAQTYLEIKEKADLFEYSLGYDTVFIKVGHEKIKVKLHDIVYLEALKDYTSIITAQKKYCVLASLGHLLQEDNFRSFIRIHRSFAVQKHFIRKVDTRNVYLDKMTLPLGKAFKDDIDELMQ